MKRIRIIPFSVSMVSIVFAFILIVLWLLRNDAEWSSYGILIAGMIIGGAGSILSLTERKRISRFLSLGGGVVFVLSTAFGDSDLTPSMINGAGDLWIGGGIIGGAVLLLIIFIEIAWTVPSIDREDEGNNWRSYLISLAPVTGASLFFIVALFGLVHLVMRTLPKSIFLSLEAGSVFPLFIVGILSLAVLLIIYTLETLVLKLLRI